MSTAWLLAQSAQQDREFGPGYIIGLSERDGKVGGVSQAACKKEEAEEWFSRGTCFGGESLHGARCTILKPLLQ